MTSTERAANLAIMAAASVAAEKATGYPSEVTVAQWAVECGWSMEHVTGDHNLFGLTAATYPDHPKKFCLTREDMTLAEFSSLPQDEKESVVTRVDLGHGRYRYMLSRWFACFGSMADGVSAYIRLITTPRHRYSAAWKAYQADNNIDRLIDGIAKAGYATSSSYGALVKQIVHQENVTKAVKKAREALSVPHPNSGLTA